MVVPKVKKTLRLKTKLPGTNQVIADTKNSRWSYDKTKKKLTNSIIRELIAQKCVPSTPYEKIRVSYKFYEGENPRDPDNILMGMKYIHDAFVSTGIVEDDNIWCVSLGGIEFIPGNKFKVVVSWEVEKSD